MTRGHSVDFFLESKWTFLAEALAGSGSLSIYPLPFDNAAFFRIHKTDKKKTESSSTDSTTRSPYLQNLIRIQRDYIWPTYPSIHQVAVQAQAIIANSFATYLVCHLAKALQIAAFLLHLQPLLPNQVFPSYRLNQEAFVQAIVQYYQHHSIGPNYDPEYQFEVNPDLYLALLEDGVMNSNSSTLLEWNKMKDILAGYHAQFTIVNAYNHSIIPPLSGTPGLGSNVVDVGSLADNYVSPLFRPSPDLTQFLQHHTPKKPICIGFGSMPIRSRQVSMVAETVRVLVEQEQPVILVGDALQPAAQQQSGLVYHASSIPYPHLLLHCSLMVSHGGAGVLQAALRAGTPSLACPVVGDQFALAALIEGLGYGRQLLWVQGNRVNDSISAQDFLKQIHLIQQSKQIQDNCRRVSQSIAQEDANAAAKLANMVEEASTRHEQA